jgi:transaldolase/glucose-6-phosphate isomerase
MRVAIGSDHAGFELKEAIKAFLASENRQVLDVGTHSRDPIDHPDFTEAVGAAVRDARAQRGIIVCASGVGASMTANRIPGVRAAMCHDTYSAHQGVEHDDMNVLVIGGRVVGVELARELVSAFLNATYHGNGRHVRRAATAAIIENPVRTLQLFGQSVWLDYMRSSLVSSGELRRLIDDDGVRGVTSNPSIVEKAVAGSSDYAELLQRPDLRALDAGALYELIAIQDVRDAADALRGVYEQTGQRDGYVSLEVSPFLAYDTAAMISEARRLWRAVDRANLMVKVPATPQGLPAIRQLIADGINVNATLLFSTDTYQRVALAYLEGIEDLTARGGALDRVASVASFFVSRIDAAVDGLAAAQQEQPASAAAERALRLALGRVAIANAKLAYQAYQEIFSGPRWRALAGRGARSQRLLWASTAATNPMFSDVRYVEELIGPETITTLPRATLEAFRDHGRPRASLAEDLDAARDTMAALADAGIVFKEVTDRLLADGVDLFSGAFGKALKAIDRQRTEAAAGRIDRLTYALPAPLETAVAHTIGVWASERKAPRIWGRDASLWTGRDEGQWLGWLSVAHDQAEISRLQRIAELARRSACTDVLLLGMGGSSLCADVLRSTFGNDRFPALHVLDSTDPAQVKAFEHAVDLTHTLFVVSSKSGSTLEPNILKDYFFDQLVQRVGRQQAGRSFIAITDPGSTLHQIAERDGFRRIFFGWPTIGGRFSALSDFGLVPAALIGIDLARFLDRTEEMVAACMPSVPADQNPAVVLGAVLGVAASQFGRDKVTIIISPRISSLGAWLEQLLAESTGKDGRGLIPIDGEPLASPDAYGLDRMFVYLRLKSAPDPAQDAWADAIARAGHPLVRITLDDVYDLGEEFFRWEFATAVAASILGVNPFDQPDVEASKTATRKLTADFERSGALPAETPILTSKGIDLFADETTAGILVKRARSEHSLVAYLRAHLERLAAGDYFALLAYVEMNASNRRLLQAIRKTVGDARRVATCLEFGPRFLHSTGQAYKGGPDSGVFLQITSDDAADILVPGRRYTFGVVKAAQARGDFQVLIERNRRALRAHLGADVASGLRTLHAAITTALGA